MDKLGDLPPLALVALGTTLAFIFGVRYLGLLQGQNTTPDRSSAAAQVAAVIVDPTALNRASSALEAHTAAVSRMVLVGEELTRAVTHMATEYDRLREEMRIHREIDRRERGRDRG